MREYLLGRLSSAGADALEDRYFADRKALLGLEACERRLIEDYLKGKISSTDRDSFEQRYLAVPELRRRLDAHRAQLTNRLRQRWRFALVAATAFLIIGGVFWSSTQLHRTPAGNRGRTIAPSVVIATLSPGLTKGAGKQPTISVPQKEAIVRFRLELPADGKSDMLSASLDRIGDNGERTRLHSWPPPLKEEPVAAGHAVSLDLSSNLLQHADYILSLRSADGAVLETYVFRAE